jgi:ABC-2 type transport system permease protein
MKYNARPNPRPYIALFGIRFITGLQYRAAALAGLSTQFAWGFMLLLGFRAFRAANPAAFPMSESELASYIWLQQAFIAWLFIWFWDNDIFASITTGGVAYELVRPIGLYNRWFVQSMGQRVARTTLRCVPIVAVAAFLPGDLRLTAPPTWQAGGLFALSMLLALGVVVSLGMLMYGSAVRTISAYGMRVLVPVLADFFAGAVVPLPFFPDSARRVFELLPFAMIQNVPLRVYSGHMAGAEAWQAIGLQAFWLASLILLGRTLFKKALRKVVVQGG